MGRIILEGLNGTGKTTLGLKLADELGLAYYRRRVNVNMMSELTRALMLEDAIIDRSWLSEIHYSNVKGRPCGISLPDTFYLGLLAARRCVSLVKMLQPIKLPETWTAENLELRERYTQMHWSEPKTSLKLEDVDRNYEALVLQYKSQAQMLDACPSDGIGSAHPCDVLFQEPYTQQWGEICYYVGLLPRNVHFGKINDENQEYFKPKLVCPQLGQPFLRYQFETFERQLEEAGVTRYPPIDRDQFFHKET